ncbi:MAG: hypothetical protein JJE01_06635 [Gemmatimonadetes bacterium]|nr:hypothetical protein [Gemmatimonadota bacterium]
MDLLAAAVPGPRTGLLVVAYLVASIVASIPYIRWRKRYHKAHTVQESASSTL